MAVNKSGSSTVNLGGYTITTNSNGSQTRSYTSGSSASKSTGGTSASKSTGGTSASKGTSGTSSSTGSKTTGSTSGSTSGTVKTSGNSSSSSGLTYDGTNYRNSSGSVVPASNIAPDAKQAAYNNYVNGTNNSTTTSYKYSGGNSYTDTKTGSTYTASPTTTTTTTQKYSSTPYTVSSPTGQSYYDQLASGKVSSIGADKTSDGSTWTLENGKVVVTGKDGTKYYAQKAATSGSTATANTSTGTAANAIQMSAEDQAEIKRYQDIYNTAKATGNTAAMNAAHNSAEAIRAKYGFSGGVAGNEYNQIQTATKPQSSAVEVSTWADQKKYDQLVNGKVTEVTASDGSKWVYENGQVVSYGEDGVKRFISKSAELSDATRESISDAAGHTYNLIKLTNGDIVDITDENGNELQTGMMRLKLDGKTTVDCIITPNEDGIGNKVVQRNSSVDLDIVDRQTLESVTFTNEAGQSINRNSIVLGMDNRVYCSSDGMLLRDVASGVEDSANYVVRVDDQYWDFNNNNVTGSISILPRTEDWLTDKTTMLNALMTELFGEGYTRAPTYDSTKELTYEQALAQAANQLGASYDAAFQKEADAMNQRALQSGFYGQLPTEALLQQALASSEVDKQSAIFNLANDLVGNSKDYAQQLYENEVEKNQNRQNTLMSIINSLYDNYATEISKANSEAQAQQIENNYKNQMLSLALNAIGDGVYSDTLKRYVGNIQ